MGRRSLRKVWFTSVDVLLALEVPREPQMWFMCSKAVPERGKQTDVFGKHPKRCWDTFQLGPNKELGWPSPGGQNWDRQWS